jgi:hypothetical protein
VCIVQLGLAVGDRETAVSLVRSGTDVARDRDGGRTSARCPPLGPDVHANNDGYGVIAQAFATAHGL